VAVFGLTDPEKTGPLGAGHRILRPPGVTGSRDIPRDSRAARAALESVSPEQVYAAAGEVLAAGGGERVISNQ
jgi:hypothetical protein